MNTSGLQEPMASFPPGYGSAIPAQAPQDASFMPPLESIPGQEVPQLPTQPAPQMPPVASPEGLIAAGRKGAEQSLAQHQQADQLAENAADQGVQLASEEQAALAPVKQQAAQRATMFADATQRLQAQAQTQIGAYMAHYETTINELANAKLDPMEVWGGSEGRRVLGAVMQGIAQFASGLTGQPNQAIAIIDAAARRAMARQHFEAQMKGKQAEGYQNLVGMARQKLGDDITAQSAVYNAYLEATGRMVDELQNRFKTPEAQKAATMLKQQLMEKRAESTMEANKYFTQTAYNGLALSLQNRAMELKNSATKQNSLAGFTGQIPNDTLLVKAAEINGGARSAIEIIGDIQNKLREGSISVGQVRELMAENAPLGFALRKFLNTGARLEGEEARDLNSMRPSVWETLPGIKDVGKVQAKFDAAKRAIAMATLRTVTSYAPQGSIMPDPADPIYGAYLRGEVEHQKKQKARQVLRAGTPAEPSDD